MLSAILLAAALTGPPLDPLASDTSSQFPVRVISRNQDDAVIETVMMDALDIDVPLTEALFDPERK